jgi:hypothetical protein
MVCVQTVGVMEARPLPRWECILFLPDGEVGKKKYVCGTYSTGILPQTGRMCKPDLFLIFGNTYVMWFVYKQKHI